MLESFLIKVQAFIKGDSTIDVFCEICKIFKNTYFKERLQATASKLLFREKTHLLIKMLDFMILDLKKNNAPQSN